MMLSAGENHTLLLMSDNRTLYSFGNNQQGQLGYGRGYSNNSHNPGEVQISVDIPEGVRRHRQKPVKIKQIATGRHHSLVLAQNGQVFGCGKASDGELGLGHIKEFLEDIDQT